MHIATFLQDLALIMIVAGIVTIIFHQLKQPVVLGYILAGVILGPHTPPFSFIHDETTIKTLAELGVIFLMFSLGLEFSIRKLFRVGQTALIVAVAEIVLMILVGYKMGLWFGWGPINSLFLGTMLAISSTTIIIKALNELGMKNQSFAQIIFGILIIEDILAIGILAILSSISISGSLDFNTLIITLGKLLIFIVVSIIIGIMIIPKFLTYIAQFNSKEMLLITVLGLCFGFTFVVIQLGYSTALGAFLIGAIMAESHRIKTIEKLIEPITNMFSAIFFVSIGLLVDPHIMKMYWLPIIIITIALVIGKVLVCSLGAFLAGRDGRTSMRIGMGLAQIGEFSFIIASLGISLNVMSPFLYPIIVAISAITTFLTPYLIKMSDPFAAFLASHTPRRLSKIFSTYTTWIAAAPENHKKTLIKQTIKKGLLKIFINLILITAVFIGGSYLAHTRTFSALFNDVRIENSIIWGTAFIISLPFLVAVYRKLKGLMMLIAEITTPAKLQRTIYEIIPIASIFSIVTTIIALTTSILPPLRWLVLILIISLLLTALLWPWFIKLHAKLQITFMESLKKKKNKH